MNKTILLIIVCVFCSSCDPQQFDITRENALTLGDSNCAKELDKWRPTAPDMAGFKSNCEMGRRLIDWGNTLPPGFDFYTLDLALNDAQTNVGIQDYRDKLTTIISSTSSIIYCVLPVTGPAYVGYSVDPYREAMSSICANTIDPLDYNINLDDRSSGPPDGKHLSKFEREVLASVYVDKYEKEKLAGFK